MYIVDGIAYAGTKPEDMKITSVKVLGDMMLLLTFASGEKRLYDATQLLQYPVFQQLADERVMATATVDHGVVVWLGGEIDIAPETMYANSFAYEEKIG